MADFGLVMPFGIDGGELDGLSPQQCFVLGYELAQIYAALDDGRKISKPVHAANRERIERLCRDAGVVFRLDWCVEDTSESWMILEVDEVN